MNEEKKIVKDSDKLEHGPWQTIMQFCVFVSEWSACSALAVGERAHLCACVEWCVCVFV